MTIRKCGDCQLCCKLVPVPTIGKPANQKCCHQRARKGCSIYPRRPNACAVYSCRWLADPETSELSRPDRSHYVLDPMPDFVRCVYENGDVMQIPAIQVWCDPKFPDAHRDPKLRSYLNERGQEGYVAIIRYDHAESFMLTPPSIAADGCWHEKQGEREPEHSTAEIVEVLYRRAAVAELTP